MSISTELSSELAAAVLKKNQRDDPIETIQLLAMVAQVHSALRHLTTEERKKQRRLVRPATQPLPGSSAPRDI
jgi:predicted transcriptional regulator